MPVALTVNAAPVPVGVWLAGLGVQVAGGPVVPAVQLRFTALAYPFNAVNVPWKVALWPGKIVCGESEIAIE
jgi:hypothetical protein